VLAGKHALEFESFHLAFEAADIGVQCGERFFVAFLHHQFEQLIGVVKAAIEPLERIDNRVQRGAFTTELLRPFRLVPDAGLAQFEFDFAQSILLDRVVKDTP
jgi:ABC-type uncharacterized transport system permease subunit